jgi:hypothetical protein
MAKISGPVLDRQRCGLWLRWTARPAIAKYCAIVVRVVVMRICAPNALELSH